MNQKLRIPPQNLAAEKSLLASQMLTGKFGASKFIEDVVKLRETLSLEDYYSDLSRKVQKAIWQVYDANDGNVDVILVGDQLESNGDLAEIGGPHALLEILEAEFDSSHMLSYAAIVVSRARRRKMIAIGEQLVQSAFDVTKDDQEIIENAHDAAMRMAESLSVKRSRPRTLQDHTQAEVNSLATGALPSLWWGIREIDDLIQGVSKGDLIVIGARPSHGKSCVALQWLDEASRKGIAGLMISEEMSTQNVASRTIAYLSKMPKETWRDNITTLVDEVKQHFSVRAPVLVSEKCRTIAKVERTIARAVKSHRVQIVAVDYAQMVEGKGDTLEQQIGNVSMRLKQVAGRHEIVILLLAQLNRQVQGRNNLVPQSSDLKGSGSLEADADVILLPYIPSMLDPTYANKNEYRILCDKNRNREGRGQSIEMVCDFKRQRILPVDGNQREFSDYVDRQF